MAAEGEAKASGASPLNPEEVVAGTVPDAASAPDVSGKAPSEASAVEKARPLLAGKAPEASVVKAASTTLALSGTTSSSAAALASPPPKAAPVEQETLDVDSGASSTLGAAPAPLHHPAPPPPKVGVPYGAGAYGTRIPSTPAPRPRPAPGSAPPPP